jgi:hypothetical protein
MTRVTTVTNIATVICAKEFALPQHLPLPDIQVVRLDHSFQLVLEERLSACFL